MKQGMTNVDVAALAAELRPLLVGSRIDKVYQPAKDQVLLRVRRKGLGKTDLLFELGRFLVPTRRAPENPDRPSMLAQVLRTTFENARVVAFQQVGFDRVLRMDTERGDGKRALVFEVFGDGNLLVLDAEGTIELPMRGADFSARTLRKGEPYVAPPGSARPFQATDEEWRASLAACTKDLVRFLAVEQGFGPLWGEEICLRSKVPKATKASALDAAQQAAVLAVVRELGDRTSRADLEPCLVHEANAGGPALADAVPFPMLRYAPPSFAHEQANTFAEALEAAFVGESGDDADEVAQDPRRKQFDDARGKLGFQLAQIEEAMGRFVAEEKERKLDGDAIWGSFQDVQAILAALHAARADRSWADVERTLAEKRAEGNAWALRIPRLLPHEGTAVLRLDAPPASETPPVAANRSRASLPAGAPARASPYRDVEVDLRKSVQDNADTHYEAAKKARSRREGAATAQKDTLAKIAELERKGLDGFGPARVKEERVRHHFWFETYRWTLTPSGLVAVGGRSGPQNDTVVKKYLRDGDRYVHADIHGAPSVVVRDVEGNREPSEADLRAAGQFAVCASRAWRQFGNASAYWVTAAQVSKTPRSGEFVPRGAWIIHGKHTPMDALPMDWWVARVHFTPAGKPLKPGDEAGQRTIPKLVGGPKESLETWGTDLVHIVPGEMGANEAAAVLAERFGVSSEEGQAVLPAGSVRFPDLVVQRAEEEQEEAA